MTRHDFRSDTPAPPHPSGSSAALPLVNGTLDHNVRISCKTVTFAHPFRLPGIAGNQAAGSYEVETEEEALAEVSYPAWRRRATTMRIKSQAHGRPAVELVPIDPIWLGHALDDDHARTEISERKPDLPRDAPESVNVLDTLSTDQLEKRQRIADWEDEGGALRGK